MYRFLRLIVLLLALVGLAAIGGVLWLWTAGISTSPEPGPFEAAVARRLRSFAIPADARRLTNPLPPDAENLRAGMEHYADHCAVCHANDGSGDTEIGRGLSPRAPDMRLGDTQELSDGELFYIIENGIRFTGMPRWGTGTPEGEAASWHLAQFIRHLPALTAEEVEEMRRLNPRSLEEWREEEEMRRFLDGGNGTAPEPHAPRHEHGDRK